MVLRIVARISLTTNNMQLISAYKRTHTIFVFLSLGFVTQDDFFLCSSVHLATNSIMSFLLMTEQYSICFSDYSVERQVVSNFWLL